MFLQNPLYYLELMGVFVGLGVEDAEVVEVVYAHTA
jgi:hypothetical protein